MHQKSKIGNDPGRAPRSLYQHKSGNTYQQNHGLDCLLGPLKVSTSLIGDEKSEMDVLGAMEQLGMRNGKSSCQCVQTGLAASSQRPRAILSSPENDERLGGRHQSKTNGQNGQNLEPKKLSKNKNHSPGSVSSSASVGSTRRFKVTYVQDTTAVALGRTHINSPVNRRAPPQFHSNMLESNLKENGEH